MLVLTRLSGFIAVAFFCTAGAHKVLDEVPLIDGHNDLAYNLYVLANNNLTKFNFSANLENHPTWGTKACPSCFTDLPRLRKGKVGALFFAAYVACSTQYKDSLAKTLEQIDVIKRLVRKYPQDMAFVTTAQGITDAFKNRKIAGLIGVEGGHSMDSRMGVLRTLYELGVRYMTLTHTCNTPWADNSFVDDTNASPFHNLTEFGKLVVKEMNRLGMMVDLSHVSHQVMNQAILTSKAPVIFSHSSAYAIFPHHRNVHDDTLALVKEHKGIVMVNFYSGFIAAKNATIHDVVKHINYIAKITGVDSVGIGGDYDGVDSMPLGLDDVSKYPDLFNLLQKEDPVMWTDENLKKLASENLLRVFRDVEAVRDSMADQDPQETWISIGDLNNVQTDVEQLWKCRTLLNNTSLNPNPSGKSSATTATVTSTALIATVLYAFLML